MKYMYYLACLLATFQVYGVKHIIFELDDVLFRVGEMETIKNVPVLAQMGEKIAASYMSQYLEILSKDHTYDFVMPKHTTVLFRNKRIPSLLCAFFLDAVTADAAYKHALEVINTHISWYDVMGKMALRYAAQAEFDAKHEINYMFPVPQAHALVRKLVQNPHNKVYIFSNKNSGTFATLQKRYPELFEPFAGRISISGHTKKLKPHASAYEQFFATYGINPIDAYFIEAQQGYLDTAKPFKAKCLKWSEKNAHTIEKQLLQ